MNPNFPNSSCAPSQVATLRRALLPLIFCAALTSGTIHAQEAHSAPPEPAPHSAAIQPPQEPQQTITPHTHLRQGSPVVYQSFRPCRIVDTRNSDAPFGGPKLAAGATRNFNLVPSGGACGDTLPAGATALAINVTITQTENEGFLTVWPGGQAQPLASVINWTSSGTTVANAIIVPVGTDGSINVFSHQGTHLILDISGYYLSTLEAGDQLSIVGNNSSAAIVGVNNGTGAGVRGASTGTGTGVYGESASGVAGYFAGNAVVTGNLGVGTETPGSKLTVAGVIESSTGGIKFPDGTVQTSAATGGGIGSFIQNTTTQQPGANFNIEGNGTAGGALSANAVNSATAVNAATQYNIGGQRVLSTGPLGTANLFVGFDAGTATTACCNAFVGNEAGRFNTTGSANAFFGYYAGLNNTTASANSFFGNRAGFSNTTGFDNAFFGMEAGTNNTTGNRNTFVGTLAGRSNTTASNNSFFGNEAGRFNTTGSANALFGYYAGLNNTTGHGNAFFGAGAGTNNATGVGNTFVGTEAGVNNTTGGDNTFVGRSAGVNNTTGINNTVIGTGADVNPGNLTYATAIGAGVVVSTSNTVVLGRGTDTVHVPGLGLVLRSPGGNCFRLRVSDTGALTTTPATCP